MSLTRIKTGEPQVIPDERWPAYHLGSHPNQAAQRAEAPNPPGRREGEPTPLQLALARGHRWFAMLESGNVKSLKEIAKRESVDTST